jgi:hypothetical protein
MNNNFDKKINTILQKEQLEKMQERSSEVLFHEINPDNLKLPELKEKLLNDIEELRISIGGLRNEVAERADPYKLSEIYDDFSKQIYEKQQQISNIENVMFVDKNREPILLDSERKFIETFRTATEDQDPELN